MTVLGTLSKHFQKDAPDVLAQIAVKQPELAHIGGLVTLGLMDTANQALEGMDLIKQGNQPVESTPTNTQGTFINSVGSAFTYQPAARATAFETAKAIYTSMAFDMGIDRFDDNLWETAIDLAVGKNPNTGKGGIQEVRDMPVIAPPELSGEDLENMLEMFTAGTLADGS